MKFKQLCITLAAALALGLAGCSKNEPVTPTANAADKAVESAKADAAKAADSAKAETAKVTDAARAEAAKAEAARVADPTKVEPAKAVNNGKAQELIDKAKDLVAENRFSDASSVLQQLAGQSLSGEQTKLVATLKEQTNKALAVKAAGAGGDLLKK